MQAAATGKLGVGPQRIGGGISGLGGSSDGTEEEGRRHTARNATRATEGVDSKIHSTQVDESKLGAIVEILARRNSHFAHREVERAPARGDEEKVDPQNSFRIAAKRSLFQFQSMGR